MTPDSGKDDSPKPEEAIEKWARQLGVTPEMLRSVDRAGPLPEPQPEPPYYGPG